VDPQAPLPLETLLSLAPRSHLLHEFLLALDLECQFSTFFSFSSSFSFSFSFFYSFRSFSSSDIALVVVVVVVVQLQPCEAG
jgi:hypothetical protein